MQYLSIKDLLLRERKKNAAAIAGAIKNDADINYIAMMCDIELETPDDEEKADSVAEEVEYEQ